MLNWAIHDMRTRAIVCTRGGYGALRILDRINYQSARDQLKVVVGFSDATALHMALYQKAGWRGLSGPLVVGLAECKPAIFQSFLDQLRGALAPPVALTGIRSGKVTGALLGGNLATIVRMVGTPYLPSFEGAILVVEDVGEAPYRIDALFAQLRLAGILDTLGGAVLGAFTGWELRGSWTGITPDDIIADYFGNAPYPVATGLPYGHFADRMVLPIGVTTTLEVTGQEATLTPLRSVFS